jgi:hypothetical protein
VLLLALVLLLRLVYLLCLVSLRSRTGTADPAAHTTAIPEHVLLKHAMDATATVAQGVAAAAAAAVAAVVSSAACQLPCFPAEAYIFVLVLLMLLVLLLLLLLLLVPVLRLVAKRCSAQAAHQT